MVKLKFFFGNRIEAIEDTINNFLSGDNIEYIDIKLSVGLGQLACILTYREQSETKG